MNRTLFSSAGLGLVVVFFLGFMLVNSWLLGGIRLDLTEHKLYTVSEGSRSLLQEIDEPVDFYLYFSDTVTEDLPPLRNYALRVRELLQEFEQISKGKVNLHIIDPEPFSEAEDRAAEHGLQAVPLQGRGETIYFGLVGTNETGDKEVIEFFHPSQEELLEYEISKLLHNLIHKDKPVIGLLSGLEFQGGFDQITGQPKSTPMIFEQMAQQFELEAVASDVMEIPGTIDILMVVYPKQLSDQTMYAVDQFVLTGGRAVIIVDPHSQFDLPDPGNPVGVVGAADLSRLLTAWGVTYDPSKVVGDRTQALSVNIGAGSSPVSHLAMLGVSSEQISDAEVATSGLEKINMTTVGFFEESPEATTRFTPLLQSSDNAQLFDAAQFQYLSDPRQLQIGFEASGQRYALMARVDGKAKSAFPEGVEGSIVQSHVNETDQLQVILMADTDWLEDRMWVTVQNFFGQKMVSSWADNSTLLLNTLEYLGGNSALISIRSRGKYSRPFEVVNQLKRQAEGEFLKQEQQLNAQLQQAEQKLMELEQSKAQQSSAVFNSEQQQTLNNFRQEKIKIRKQLREVRHQLDEDIDALGTTLKLINIGLVPVLLSILMLVIGLRRKKINRNLVAP